MGRSVSYASGSFAKAYSHYDYDDIDDFDYIVEDYKEMLKQLFPSFVDCDKWLGREDRAVLENSFAYAGISEYCGLVCYWLVLKDDLISYDKDLYGLANQWAGKVEDKFINTFSTLHKIGAFSNGEAIFERREVNNNDKQLTR